jgi:hypothetical protein
MASKADFTEAEWQTLEKGLIGAAMLVATADASFFDTFKEMGTLASHMAEARQKSTSQLVRDLGATHTTGFGMGTSPTDLEAGTLEALRSALALLDSKAADESQAYSAFVMELSESVAQAVSGVSASENTALEKIKGALADAH